jgi:CHAT domain-containing protein
MNLSILAGGLIVAGSQAAIGTLWSMKDSDSPKVAELVYQWLLDHRKTLDVYATAEALHFAVQSLKDAGAPFEQWMPFIHMGSYIYVILKY